MTYKSPIEIIQRDIHSQMNIQFENDIYSAVQKVGINVDKDELVKALQYDRNQYQKGYDAAKEFYEKVIDKVIFEIFLQKLGCSMCPCYCDFELEIANKECIERIKKWVMKDVE